MRASLPARPIHGPLDSLAAAHSRVILQSVSVGRPQLVQPPDQLCVQVLMSRGPWPIRQTSLQSSYDVDAADVAVPHSHPVTASGPSLMSRRRSHRYQRHHAELLDI